MPRRRRPHAGCGQDRRHQVDDVPRGRPEFAAGGDAGRPVDDQRGRDAALVDPRLVPAEGRVGQARPARPDAQEGRPGAALGVRVVAVPADHDLGARAVVGQEENERVGQGTRRPEVGHHPADFEVHAGDHRRVDGHFPGLKRPLVRGQLRPRQRPVQLVRPELLHRVRVGVGRAEVALDGRQGRAADLERLHPPPALVAEGVPAGQVGRAVRGDVRGRRLHGEVRRGERQVLQERRLGRLRRVLRQALDGVVGDGRRGVVPRLRVGGRQRLAVLGVEFRREVPVVVVQAVRVVEPVRQRLAVHVPLARVVRPIPERLEQFREQSRPVRPGARRAALDAGHGVAADLLGVIAGENGGARRPAPGRVRELREPQPVRGQRVEVRRGDLAAVTPEVGEAQVVRDDEQDVRLPRRRDRREGRQHHQARQESARHELCSAAGEFC